MPDADRTRHPVLIAAFEGWNDAGDAASGALDHLVEVWEARQVAELDPDDYYDFQVNRPTVRTVDGDAREVSWPTTRFYQARPPGSDHDVFLARGIEPNMRWRGFTAAILEVAQGLGVRTVVTLGALLADSPHTRPVPVTGTTSDPRERERLALSPSRYEGPTGIVGVLQDAAQRSGLPAVSLWAAVPHYVAQPPCPKATVALLHRVEDVLDVAVELSDLPQRAREWEAQVDELTADDSDVADYVASLEQRETELPELSELPEASGDAIARDFERYLRRRGE